MGGGVHTKSILQLAREQAETLPSPEALERFGTYNMLALIYDAIGHLVTPVHRLPKVIPALEQIVSSLAEQQGLLKEMLSIQKDAALVRLVADRLERVPSLSHSVLNRDLRFVSVNKPYAHLFEFSPTQLQNMSLIELLHPKDISRFNKITRVLLKGRAGTCELIQWRATGSGRFVLTKDTLWGIGSDRAGGPEYISTVSEKIADQDEAAKLAENAKWRTRGRSSE